MRRRLAAVQALAASLCAAFLVLAGSGAGPASAATPYPDSMSALGDSITRAYNAGGWFSDWPARSWSTGTYSTVKSHYSRLVALHPALSGHAYNDARTGAKMRELATQASTSVSQRAQYVTILMGANDACTSTESGMTSVSSFATQFSTAMQTLAAQSPQPQVLVASIPDVYRLYSVGRNSSAARSAWAAYDICQSMLANPLSTAQADVDRRARVRQRVVNYNTKLSTICATYTFCKYDGGAVFGYPFTLSQLSGWDYFHPNNSGQAALANVTYNAGFWPPA